MHDVPRYHGALLRTLRRNQDFLESAILALVLPFVAGAINASGFFIVGTYTSHVTGTVARVGDELAQGNRNTALEAALLVLTFFLGAVTATALVHRARRRHRARYSMALLCEAVTLLVITLLGIADPKSIPGLHFLTTALLCFGMGSQNALVTRMSGAVVRTTHLTGIVTDIGIEVVSLASWLRGETSGAPDARRAGELWRLSGHPEFAGLRLHLGIFFSFLAGAVIGPILYLRWGYASMILPIALLLALTVFDHLIGLQMRTAEPDLSFRGIRRS